MNSSEVAVAMSGGVDSTVAAYLAQRSGCRVTGIHLKLEPGQPEDEGLRRSCEALGIPLVERDCSAFFYEKVLKRSALEYASGRTPNPCCLCNKVLKFAELFAQADRLGISRVFTGHYVRLEETGGKFRLRRGMDGNKDQSYFLYRLSGEDLSRTGFPLGSLTKDEVRRIAADAGLDCASRRDSQDACFQIAGECCGETLRRRCGLPVKDGFFLWRGKPVGRHGGIHRYTVGQRQGLQVALGVPAYIRRIDAESGDIELTTDPTELFSSAFTIGDAIWQWGNMPEEPLTVKVRYRSPGVECRLEVLPDHRIRVYPAVPLRAVTPGQSAVFYAGDLLAGGGVIEDV